MINRVVMVGRMTKDPELRRTAKGEPVTSFTLAVNRNFKNAQGNTDADFINCIIWHKSAENVERYCSKGSLVGIEGRIQSRTYDNNQGQKVFVTEVVCDSVQFLNTKQQDQTPVEHQMVRELSNNEQSSERIGPNYSDNFNTYDIMDEDIQF